VLGVLRRLYDDVAGWHGLWAEFLRGQEERDQLLASKVRNPGVTNQVVSGMVLNSQPQRVPVPYTKIILTLVEFLSADNSRDYV
jgi:hypothetical protein